MFMGWGRAKGVPLWLLVTLLCHVLAKAITPTTAQLIHYIAQPVVDVGFSEGWVMTRMVFCLILSTRLPRLTSFSGEGMEEFSLGKSCLLIFQSPTHPSCQLPATAWVTI